MSYHTKSIAYKSFVFLQLILSDAVHDFSNPRGHIICEELPFSMGKVLEPSALVPLGFVSVVECPSSALLIALVGSLVSAGI